MNSAFNNSFLGCKNLHEILETVKKFKIKQIIRYNEEVIQGRGKKMRSEVRYRHEKLYEIVKQFDEYNIVQKTAELIDTAVHVGWLMSSVNSKK